MIKKIYLIGNPNVGKSVVFSRITGVRVMSSNYPGTTVEISKGGIDIGGERIEVLDLPGAYSLDPTCRAEEVAVSLLNELRRNEIVVINVLDATNLERNLVLTLRLIEEGFPVIACLNMFDEAGHKGINIDTARLESLLGVPVVPTCAITGAGIKDLMERLKDAAPASRIRPSDEERWADVGRIAHEVQHLEHRHHTLRETLEDASVQPVTGFVMAAGVIYASFRIVRFIGEGIINKLTDPIFHDIYRPMLERLTAYWQESGFWFHLLIGDLVGGKIDFKQSLGLLTTAPYIEFGMVLPYVISFYLVLSILEDIGYLPRLAILLDNLMHRLGLHGFAVIPVLLGFGCNVPAILATRSLESKRERFIAATIISIGVPCVPLQAMIFGLLGAFGGRYVAGVYFVLFALIAVLGLVLNRILKGYSPEFLLEIPPYRLPPLAALFGKLYFRVKGFLIEAVPVVLAGVMIVNILIYFRLFDRLADITAPVIHGLFGLPKEAVVALVIGFIRKDVAVGMLMPLDLSAKQLFIAATLLAVSFPCIATFIVMWKELGVKDLIKSTFIMVSVSLMVGTALNLIIR